MVAHKAEAEATTIALEAEATASKEAAAAEKDAARKARILEEAAAAVAADDVFGELGDLLGLGQTEVGGGGLAEEDWLAELGEDLEHTTTTATAGVQDGEEVVEEEEGEEEVVVVVVVVVDVGSVRSAIESSV